MDKRLVSKSLTKQYGLRFNLQALTQLNTKLEEENRTLMMQLQALLNQNQEMLTQSLESKDHFHEEERAYM